MKYLFFSLAILANIYTHAQSVNFSQIDAGIVNVARSSVNWGDYDNDGDLDLLITGDKSTTPYVAAIYRNDNGEFVNINADLIGIYNGMAIWGDYDNDGDLDILACGRNSENSKTFIYQNNGGAFSRKEVGLPDIGMDGSVTWGDYDNDGDLDILLTGNGLTAVMNNNFGIFTNIEAGLPGLNNSWGNFGDFDNDGDLDIFIMGDIGGAVMSAIFQNTDGGFSNMSQAQILPLLGGSASWYDYDNDLDLDLAVCGFDEYFTPNTILYINEGDYTFRNSNSGFTGSSLGTIAWGDYDNDGAIDLLLTGKNAGCSSISSLVLRNEGNNNFNDINAPLTGVERGRSAWVDYDNDGDLDILITGTTLTGAASTKLYNNSLGNNTFSKNTAPTTPQNIHVEYMGHNKVNFSWSASSDDITASNLLTYNIRIGTAPGTQNIMSAMANIETGQLLFPKTGNTSNNTSWTINLRNGTYYWSVQAIDQSLASSPFATEQSFTVSDVDVATNENKIEVYPNPIIDKININLSANNNTPVQLILSDIYGKTLINKIVNNNNHTLNLQYLHSGMYVLQIIQSNKTSSIKLLKQ